MPRVERETSVDIDEEEGHETERAEVRSPIVEEEGSVVICGDNHVVLRINDNLKTGLTTAADDDDVNNDNETSLVDVAENVASLAASASLVKVDSFSQKRGRFYSRRMTRKLVCPVEITVKAF